MISRLSGTEIILKFLPSFCWQSSDEVFSMLNQITAANDKNLVGVYLNTLKKKGSVEIKKQGNIFLFKLVDKKKINDKVSRVG